MADIKEIVHNVIGKISQGKQNEQQQIQDAWANAVQQKDQTHAKISGWKNRTIYICVDSSGWLYHFNLERTKILRAIQKKIPEVQKIQFKIGNVP